MLPNGPLGVRRIDRGHLTYGNLCRYRHASDKKSKLRHAALYANHADQGSVLRRKVPDSSLEVQIKL